MREPNIAGRDGFETISHPKNRTAAAPSATIASMMWTTSLGEGRSKFAPRADALAPTLAPREFSSTATSWTPPRLLGRLLAPNAAKMRYRMMASGISIS